MAKPPRADPNKRVISFRQWQELQGIRPEFLSIAEKYGIEPRTLASVMSGEIANFYDLPKCSARIARAIREDKHAGVTFFELIKKYGLSYSYVQRICYGQLFPLAGGPIAIPEYETTLEVERFEAGKVPNRPRKLLVVRRRKSRKGRYNERNVIEEVEVDDV